MDQASASKKFHFEERIDNAFIFSMYEDDFVYITEVFGSSLQTLEEDLPAIARAFNAGDMASLKQGVHKIKPIFGFTGLLAHEKIIAAFEKKWTPGTHIKEIAEDYRQLAQTIREGKDIMLKEYNRLTAFIK